MKIPNATIKFEFDETEVVADILQCQLALEDFVEKRNHDEQAILKDFIAWFAAEYHVTMSVSQAWQAVVAVQRGYEMVKKKLDDTLASDSGTPSTPSSSQTKPSDGSTDSSKTGSQSMNYIAGNPKLDSPQIGSGS